MFVYSFLDEKPQTFQTEPIYGGGSNVKFTQNENPIGFFQLKKRLSEYYLNFEVCALMCETRNLFAILE